MRVLTRLPDKLLAKLHSISELNGAISTGYILQWFGNILAGQDNLLRSYQPKGYKDNGSLSPWGGLIFIGSDGAIRSEYPDGFTPQ